MRVELLSSPADPLWLIVKACRECYSSESTTTANDHKLFLSILRKKESPLEHANFTFKISDVSRVLSHQLVRHRIASYSQQSQRYVESDGHHFTPNFNYCDNPELARVKYINAASNAFDTYFELLDLGVKREDARYIIPNCTYTSLVMTINLRSFSNLCKLRMAPKAQKEIRDLTNLLLVAITSKFPLDLVEPIISIMSEGK